MATDCKKQADNQMDTNQTVETPVLNISGCRWPRSRNKQRENTSAVGSAPKFDYKEFPLILSRKLLKSEPTAHTKSIESIRKYLCALCLNNTNANVRIYHMFYTDYKNYCEDFKNVKLLYENKPDLKANLNNISIQTICPETLHRSVLKHFTEYKWSKDGNVLESPISETDERKMAMKLHELNQKEYQKLFNYIKFLSLSKS